MANQAWPTGDWQAITVGETGTQTTMTGTPPKYMNSLTVNGDVIMPSGSVQVSNVTINTGSSLTLQNGATFTNSSGLSGGTLILDGSTASFSGQAGSGTVIKFDHSSGKPNSFTIGADQYRSNITIRNLAPGDTLTLNYATITSFTDDGAGKIKVVTGSGVTTDIYTAINPSTGKPFKSEDFTYSGGTVVCFLAGSMIRTSEGDVAVEDIQIGDQVIAFDWKNNKDITRSVVWVGKARATVRPELHDDEAGWPVRILKDAVADGVPYKDMLITAEHCLFFKDRFVPVRMLVNGVSIFYDKSITSYDYYHVETEQHSVITADGMLTESYLDTGNRSSFRQEGKVVTLFGFTKSWEDDAGAPLGVDRSFVEPLFRALEWRKDKVSKEQAPAAPELTNDPDLHLVTETGAVVRPMRKTAHDYSFMLPPSTQSVRIVSRASRPSDVIGPFVDDRRSMGVAVADVRLLCAKKPFEITSHLQTEKPEGWHETDWTDCAWTNGNAELPLGDHLAHGKMGILSITVRAAGPYIVDNQKTEKTVKSA